MIIGAFVVTARPEHLLATLILLLVGFSLGARSQLLICGRILWRLKWLFLSILIIYVLLTPGRPLWPLLGAAITFEGLALGLLRVSALMLLILAVNLLLQAQQRHEISYAIIWLLSPLQRVGFPVDRLAVRISLTLHYVREFQHILLENKQLDNMRAATQMSIPHSTVGDETNTATAARPRKRGFDWSRLGERNYVRNSLNQAIQRSAALIEAVINKVDVPHSESVQRPSQIVPGHIQWFVPVGLLTLYFSL